MPDNNIIPDKKLVGDQRKVDVEVRGYFMCPQTFSRLYFSDVHKFNSDHNVLKSFLLLSETMYIFFKEGILDHYRIVFLSIIIE